MKMSQGILTTLTILIATSIAKVPCAEAQNALASPTKSEQPTKIQQQPLIKENHSIKGEHISQVFAAACAENNFAEYQAWALKNHFMLRQFDSPTYEIAPNEIKDDELRFSVTINDQNKWQAKLRDQLYTGEDPCDLANAYLNSRTPKQMTIWSILIPEAHAQKLVNEATATNWLLGAIATAAVTDGAFIENLSNKFNFSNSFLLAAAFRATSTHAQLSTHTNFEKLLNQPTELVCSRNRVKIFGKDRHIIIKKGYIPFRVGVAENSTSKALKNDSKIFQSGKVYDHLLSLGQRCNHDGDASAINSQIQAERDLLAMKIAKASGLDRSVSSEKIEKTEKSEK